MKYPGQVKLHRRKIQLETIRPPLKKKVCFLSSGWPKSFFFVFFCKKITKIMERKKKKKGPSRHKYSHPAAGPETNFF